MKKKPEGSVEVSFVFKKEPGISEEHVVKIPKRRMQQFEELVRKSGLPIEEVMLSSLEINLIEEEILERHKRLDAELESEHQKAKQLREKLKI